MTEKKRWPVLVLLVEDNPADVYLFKQVLADDGWIYELVSLLDGQAAIDYVQDPASRRPDLVILDLNLPKRDGVEVLDAIRSNERYKDMPVAVFSTSPSDEMGRELSEAKLAADCILTKPDDLDKYLDVIRLLWECYETKLGR